MEVPRYEVVLLGSGSHEHTEGIAISDDDVIVGEFWDQTSGDRACFLTESGVTAMLPDDLPPSRPCGVGMGGIAVGTVETDDDEALPRAFRADARTWEILPMPDLEVDWSAAFSADETGTVVGWVSCNDVHLPCQWTDGRLELLDCGPGLGGSASARCRGVTVGQVDLGGRRGERAAIWRSGRPTILETPRRSDLQAVNSNGHAVGYMDNWQRDDVVLYWDGAKWSVPRHKGRHIRGRGMAINDDGWVLIVDRDPFTRPFPTYLWRDRRLFRLTDLVDWPLGVQQIDGSDMNNGLVIVGNAVVAGRHRAVLLKPL